MERLADEPSQNGSVIVTLVQCGRASAELSTTEPLELDRIGFAKGI